ncbi:hypothetical protein B0H11DRAFT_177599 [Mycena galericulata]|nr:hypothetical protein B0H11DRAFT_177599 [Mycena galericulata]
MQNEDMAALVPVFLVFAALIACAIFWCFISSCLGTPILRSRDESLGIPCIECQSRSWGWRAQCQTTGYAGQILTDGRRMGDEDLLAADCLLASAKSCLRDV